MKTFKKKLLVGAIALSFAQPSISMPVEDVTSWGILQMIQRTLDGILAALDISMKGQITANGQLADAQHESQKAMIIAKAEPEIYSSYEMAPNPCVTAGTAEAAVLVGNGAQMNTSRQLKDLTDRTIRAGNADSNKILAANNYLRNYSQGAMQNADILASSLLAGAGNGGEPKPRDYTLSQQQMYAAQAYIANITTTNALPALLSRSQMESDEGKKYLAMMRAEAAQLSLPFYSFANALSELLPIQGLGQRMGNAWRESAGRILGRTDQLPDDISPAHFKNAEVERRFANPQWYVDISSASPAAVQREQAFMQALMIKQQADMADALKRIELLMAQVAHNSIQSSPNRAAALAQYNRATQTQR